jgi:GNAT superfamily N-acetyltransferase
MTIRTATEKDIPAITRVYAQSWQSTYQGLLPEPFLKAINPVSAEKTFRESFQSEGFSYFVLAAENEDGEIMGYLDGGKDRDTLGDGLGLGEIYGMYLLEPFQRRGIGGELLRESFKKFRDLGFLEIRAWVLREGLARGFYEKEGGRLSTETKLMTIEKDSATLVSYRWNL